MHNKALLSALWALFAGGISWYCLTVAREITYVTLADGRRQERSIPLLFRLLLPIVPNLTPLFRVERFAKSRERADRRLVAAGYEGLLNAEEFFSLRILVPLVLGTVWILATAAVFASTGKVGVPSARTKVFFYLVELLCVVIYPSSWLNRSLAQRHKSVQRALPFVLDLLTLSVEAGLDFMSGLQRTIERRQMDPLGEELLRVIREIQLGKTRKESLRAMALRIDMQDIRSVTSSLIQADELGVSVGSILRIQSDQMRARRFERAEKLANEAPVKMLFPLVAFIFPAVFLVLMGPFVAQVLNQGVL